MGVKKEIVNWICNGEIIDYIFKILENLFVFIYKIILEDG